MAIRSIMCCCGSGLGSSMMVSTGVSVDHTALSEVNPNSADLFVVGRDLAPQVASYPNKIILDRIMDMNELTEKLKDVFGK